MIERSGILAGGNLLVDHVLMINHYPESGTLVTMEHIGQCVGGAPLNVLITLAKMSIGLPLSIVGVLGQDDNAHYIRQQISQHDIDASYLHTLNQGKTSYTYVMNAKDTGQRTFFHELGVNTQLDLSHFNGIHSQHKIFHLGYLLLLAALDQPDPQYGSVSAHLFHIMQEKGYKTSLDLVSVKEPEQFQKLIKPCLPYVDYLIINEWEAEQLSGTTIRNQQGELITEHMQHAASCLIAQGVNDVVVIHCPEGACAVQKDQSCYLVPSYAINSLEIKGTVGAGDAFCAGMLYALHQNIPMQTALHIANACAYFNLQAANSVDGSRPLDEIQTFIQKTPPRSTFSL